MKKKIDLRCPLAVLALATLAACGGGGGDDGSPPNSGTPVTQGAYGGTLTGSAFAGFQMLMLDGGEYWAMYGNQTVSQFLVAGFLQGTGTSNNGSFASSNARDFGAAPALAGSLSATYTATPTISGTITSGSASVGFSGGAIAGSTYNYNVAANITTIQGAWSLQSLTGEAVTLTIAGGGTFNALSSLGCNFSGTVTPRPSGRNLFNVSLTFGGAPCALPGTAASGIAVAYPLTGGTTQLIVAVRDGNRNYGTAAFGVR